MVKELNRPSSKARKRERTLVRGREIGVPIERINQTEQWEETLLVTHWKDPVDKSESVSSRPWTMPKRLKPGISEF